MLVVMPGGLYGRLGAVLSALIIVCCLIGLTMHVDFYAGIRRRDFFVYYTNLSNLLVLVYFALIAPWLYAKKALRPLIPHAEFALMMTILLTFAVFHLLLMPKIRAQLRGVRRSRLWYIVCVDNLVVHYIVPLLTLAYWLLCSPGKAALSAPDALAWTVIPLVYLLAILLRARLCGPIFGTDSAYPYPFLDIPNRGVRCVAFTCTRLYACCALAGLAAVALVRLAFSLLGAGHALALI